MMNPKVFFIAGLVLFLLALRAGATVTTFFSAGSDCSGTSTTSFVPGGPGVQVSLCVSTTTESVCGATLQLQSATAAEAGRFTIANRTLGTVDPTSNAASITYPISITNPSQSI